jgi:hypothetical protein
MVLVLLAASSAVRGRHLFPGRTGQAVQRPPQTTMVSLNIILPLLPSIAGQVR